jgi:hypothetical protein
MRASMCRSRCQVTKPYVAVVAVSLPQSTCTSIHSIQAVSSHHHSVFSLVDKTYMVIYHQRLRSVNEIVYFGMS